MKKFYSLLKKQILSGFIRFVSVIFVLLHLQYALYAQNCSPLSSFSCADIVKSFPFSTTFNGTEGGIQDKLGRGIGFSVVSNPSTPLTTPTFSTVPGYEPSLLEVANGKLNITTTPGISFLNPAKSPSTNSQVNAMGIGLKAINTVIVQTTIYQPPAGTGNSEQGGIYFGLDEDNYVKLDVISGGAGKSQIEFVKEVNAVSNASSAIKSTKQTLSTSTILLKLTIDPTNDSVTASYIINGASEITLGTLVVPSSFTNGIVLPDGTTSGISFAGIYASHRKATSPLLFTFEDFSVTEIQPAPVPNTLFFSPVVLNYTVVESGSVSNQNSTLGVNQGSPSVNLTKSASSDWLNLPAPALGSLSFGINTAGLSAGNYSSIVTATAPDYPSASLTINLQVTSPSTAKSILFTQSSQTAEVLQGSSQTLLEYIVTSDNIPTSAKLNAIEQGGNVPTWLTVNGKILNGIDYTTGSEISFNFDATNLSIGQYTATVNASSEGYSNGVLEITLTVKGEEAGALTTLNINFQDSLTSPPAGYLKDFGQAFGLRTSPQQGSGFNYGWLTTDKALLDLTKNGRKRASPTNNLLLATLMHMQGNDILSFTGTKAQGIWEIKVENGNYDVKVAVGDNTQTDSKHAINIEGVSAIAGFVPSAAVRFDSATITISVADGYLTVDAFGGINTKINFINIKPSTEKRPSVVLVNPENASQNVSENSSISTSILKLPNGGIDNSTITTANVYLKEESSGVLITANVNGTGGGDAITLTPTSSLKLGTTYIFTITDGVKDLLGFSFIPYASRFTTGSGSTSEILNAHFEKIPLPGISGQHSSVTIGPDGKLYALGIDGIIKRFVINPDGTLQDPQIIYTLQDAYGTRTPRLAIGLAFDPLSTANNLIAYITHSTFIFLDGPDWDGRLSKLSGSNLETVRDLITNLPRSSKDHLTNSIAFGPDGALYFTQGSSSAMGRADKTWGFRDERLLSAAVLRLDLNALSTALPLDVKTFEGGGTYSPYHVNAPLTIYASGVRNAYDLVWHSNGKLYVPTNGSAAGGNTPASVAGTLRPDGSVYSGPSIPALTYVQQTQKDFLFRVDKGGFYGHPNPIRGEYVLNGGNPTSAIDPAEVPSYPAGTLPDANYRGYAFDFQNNKSPNGSIEYKSNTFNGALKGKILVVRYSQNDDIITLTPGGPDKDIISSTEGTFVPGFSGFADPLDLTEDTSKGNIYVSEYGGEGSIVLLRAIAAPAVNSNRAITVTPASIYDNDVSGGAPGPNRIITVKNTGTENLIINNIALGGIHLNQFGLNALPVLPNTLAAGSTISFNVAFNPTSKGLKIGSVVISSNDAITPNFIVSVRGQGTTGLGGSNEPSLQALLNLKEIPVTVGDDDSSTAVINSNITLQKAPLLGEEVSLQRFQKAGAGPVTIEPLAVFGPTDSAIVTSLGWYGSGDKTSIKELFTVSNNPIINGQTVNPEITGGLTFDPLNASFGFYSKWPRFNNRILYSEDNLNTFAGNISHHVRIYPYKDKSGTLLANTYLVAFEETTAGIDFQDIVFIVKNVKPEAVSNSMLFVENPDKFPSNDRLVFSRILTPWGRDSVKNSNHDSINLRIHNKGVSVLTLKNLFIGNKDLWKIVKVKGLNYDSTTAFPINIPTGSFVDVAIKFVAGVQSNRVRLFLDSLTIVSNDSKSSSKIVSLSGILQRFGENSVEPYTQDIITAFGFKTKTGFGKVDPDSGNYRFPKGDEILSSYFVRADISKPISVRQLAAYHGCCTSTERFTWHIKGSTTLNTVFTHNALDGQSILPRKSGSLTSPAEGTITTNSIFGFKIGGQDWTDTTFNPSRKIGIRVWKAIDANGNLIPNTYILGNDYLGSDFTNYDYNDNVYYVKNIRPETGTSYNAELVSSPSALDFGEKILQSIDSLKATIINNGKIYSNGSQDPTLTIASVEIVGENKSEFAFANPLKSTLNPQDSTSISIAFKPVTEGLKIADILIKYNSSLTPLRIPLYGIAKLNSSTVTLHQRINSGSTQAVTTNGKTWSADNQFAFDNLEPYSNTALSQVAWTDEDVIYLIEQSSNGDKKPFRYEIPLPNGNYTVRLHFAELYWGNPGLGLNGGAGSRVMSVAFEGQEKIINLDVAQEVGTASALVKNIPVTVTDGKLNINFSATVNRPMVCGVEIYSFSTGSIIMNALTNSDPSLLAKNNQKPSGISTSFGLLKIYPNPIKNKFTINFPPSYSGNYTLEIIDPVGRTYNLGKTIVRTGGSINEIDISGYSFTSGVYFLKVVSDDDKIEILKLLVK